ncbi:MAG: 30S ribosomal protein S5 [Candidatus Kerfeldbacteria bacterium]|nr:30S ribosomal protein S5 [Candidatus Kerfeldbacteria bacterium]
MANERQGQGKGPRRGRGGNEPRDEFGQATIDLARVTRVMAGGKRMRFRACIVIGDKKGRIGLGLAKGADVALAMQKAGNDARKNIIKFPITPEGTIPHQLRIKFGSSQILLKPAPVGTGIIAGSVLRQIFELSGVRDVVGKILGTGNKINNAKALFFALGQLKPVRVAKAKPVEKKQVEVETSPVVKNE